MNKKYQKIIVKYIQSYNDFDVEGMIKDLHPTIIFENILDGKVNLKTEGIEAFKKQAETARQYFSERKQVIESWQIKGQEIIVKIDYVGVLAADFPNGLKKGETLNLKGQSVFEFEKGKIIRIKDIV